VLLQSFNNASTGKDFSQGEAAMMEAAKTAWIIGSSRGLGKAVALFMSTHFPNIESLVLVSRKEELLKQVREKALSPKNPDGQETQSQLKNCEIIAADLTNPEQILTLCKRLSDSKPDVVVYCAGGGPYGSFATKEWKDHQWSLDLGLTAPMRLTHAWLKARKPTDVGRFVIVGSRVAGLNPDPGASSYAAGKHGLVGFVSSLQKELEDNQNKVLLFSPGYMDTDMLPANAQVRLYGEKILSPETAAQALWRWLKKESHWHRVIG
jgi:short-subunit dehydrogenase